MCTYKHVPQSNDVSVEKVDCGRCDCATSDNAGKHSPTGRTAPDGKTFRVCSNCGAPC